MLTREVNYTWTQEEDIRSITTLFNVVSPKHTRSVAYWRWSNLESPFGQSLSAVGKVDGKIIAHYSVMPMQFSINGKAYMFGFGLQAVVLKEFRNLKVIKDLMDFIFVEANKRFAYTYAFPNDNFFPIKKRLLGWQEIDVFASDCIKVEALPQKANPGMEIKELLSFPKIDWFKKDPVGVAVDKTVAYLNWRFFSHPVNHYIVLGAFDQGECIGYLVLKLYMKDDDQYLIGHFVDYDSKDKNVDILKELLAAAKQIFKHYGVSKIVFWNKNNNFKSYLSSIVTAQGFKTNMGVCVGSGVDDTVFNKEAWSLTMASSDSF